MSCINYAEIKLNNEQKRKIIRAISLGNKDDLINFKQEQNLATNNSVHFLKWDFIYTNLINSFVNADLFCITIPRGPWEMVLLYDHEEKCLYSFMRSKRFTELQQKADKREYENAAHYIDALAAINSMAIPLKPRVRQMPLIDDDFAWNEEVHSVLSDIKKIVNKPIEKYVLVTFSTARLELTSVDAYILAPDLSIVSEENWNEHIIPDFDYNIAANVIEQIEDSQDDEIELKIRDHVLDNNELVLKKAKTTISDS